MRLVTENGRWATKDNKMIFCEVVWLCRREDARLYHLVDEKGENIELENPIEDYIVEGN